MKEINIAIERQVERINNFKNLGTIVDRNGRLGGEINEGTERVLTHLSDTNKWANQMTLKFQSPYT